MDKTQESSLVQSYLFRQSYWTRFIGTRREPLQGYSKNKGLAETRRGSADYPDSVDRDTSSKSHGTTLQAKERRKFDQERWKIKGQEET
jgi:hypothetical protein